jgi:hypothetical protein
MPKPIPTSERLAQMLHANGLFEMEDKARLGYYDDFRSLLATPIIQLVGDLQAKGRHDLAQRVMNGEFDSTKEEAQEWFEREGHKLLKPE